VDFPRRNNAVCTQEIKFKICHDKSMVEQKDSFHQQIGFEFKGGKLLVQCYIWSVALYGAETWVLWKVDQKYLESFETWCWRRM
jgi:hypothetical protein